MKLDKYTIGKRYGKALFELAFENQEIEYVYQELLQLREIYYEVDGLGELLSDARLEIPKKDAIMSKLTPHFEGTVYYFLCVVYRYARMNELLFMIDEYEKRYDEYQRVVLGTVVTALPLNKNQHQLIEQKTAQLLGYQTAHLINLINPKIIGGAVIEANYKLIDGSIHKQLEKMQKLLLK